MAVAQPYGFEIDFVRNPFSGSASWFFVIILKFLFTPIFEIIIHAKNSVAPKNLMTAQTSSNVSDFIISFTKKNLLIHNSRLLPKTFAQFKLFSNIMMSFYNNMLLKRLRAWQREQVTYVFQFCAMPGRVRTHCWALKDIILWKA